MLSTITVKQDTTNSNVKRVDFNIQYSRNKRGNLLNFNKKRSRISFRSVHRIWVDFIKNYGLHQQSRLKDEKVLE